MAPFFVLKRQISLTNPTLSLATFTSPFVAHTLVNPSSQETKTNIIFETYPSGVQACCSCCESKSTMLMVMLCPGIALILHGQLREPQPFVLAYVLKM